MPRRSYGPTQMRRAKRLLEALLDYGKQQLELDEAFHKRLKVTPRPDGLGLFVVGTLELLAKLTNADRHPGKLKLTESEVENAIDYLEKFLEILKRDTQQGSPVWRLTITLWHSDKEKNLKAFEDECKHKNTEKKPKAGQDPWVKVRKFVPSEFDLLDDKFFKERGRGESLILRLPSATWSLITQGNYIDRDRQEDVFAMAEELAEYTGISLLLIRGQPGAGKTALMRWLAYRLYTQENIVLQKKNPRRDELCWLESLRELSDQNHSQHFYLITDDLFRDETILEELERNDLQFPLTLIGTTRLNEDQQDRLRRWGYRIQSLDLELYPSEKERIWQRVCQQDAEAKARLEQMASAERDRLMASPSMLVLMLQLSEGKAFDLIVADVIKRLPSEADYPVYQVFGVICSFSQYRIITPSEILPLCLPDYSSKAVRNVVDIAIEAELKCLVNTISSTEYEGLVTIHELIAQTALSVKYTRLLGENLPYSPSLLEDYLRRVIGALDPTDPNHRYWISDGLRHLAVKGEDNLVRQVLNDYPEAVQSLQQQNSPTGWFTWAKVYESLELFERRDRCFNQVILTEPHTLDDWIYWLFLVDKVGSNQQKQEAMVKAGFWLQERPHEARVRIQYLALIQHCGSAEQKQEAIVQTASYLDHLSGSGNLRAKYLALIDQYGTEEQKQGAILQTSIWLQHHPEDTSVRTKYLGIIGRYGSKQQKQEALSQTAVWLQHHPEDSSVRTKYLGMIEQYATEQKKQEILSHTAILIEQYPHAVNLRISFLFFLRKVGKSTKDLDLIINKQWQWLKQQVFVKQSLWEAFLVVINEFIDIQPNLVKIIEPSVNLALKQHPCNKSINFLIFKYFRDRLNYNTVYQLSIFIKTSGLNNLLQDGMYFIYVANFFRDYGELDQAQKIYLRILKIAAHWVRKQWVDRAQINIFIQYAYLNYAYLLLLRQPPDPYKASEYLEQILDDNPKQEVAHCYMAQCYQAKGEKCYPQAIHHFQKSIQFDVHKTGFFWYQFGCFYRDAMENPTEARKCFENSLNQKINFPTCIDLAELEVQAGNWETASDLLQQGLALVPITRREKEQREKLQARIEALQKKIDNHLGL